MMLPEDLTVRLAHCGQPLRYKRGGVHWDGEDEFTDDEYVCEGCGLRVTVAAVEHVGPPLGA